MVSPQIGKGRRSADKPSRQGRIPCDLDENIFDHHRVTRSIYLLGGPESPVRIHIESSYSESDNPLDIGPQRMTGDILRLGLPGDGRTRFPRIPGRRIEDIRHPFRKERADFHLFDE